MGSTDPRLTTYGKIDFRIQRQLKSYSKEDPPPDRVKPIPVAVLRHMFNVAFTTDSSYQHAVADMMGLAFFYLLRPGEYTGAPSETTPFQFKDVQLFIGPARLDLLTATDAQIRAATFSTLTFTTQKNGVRGEVIGLGRSGNLLLCPVQISIRRVLYLRHNMADPDTPLATYYENTQPSPVTPTDITTALRLAVTILGPTTLGFLPSDISARSLRASGAMALLCAHVDTDIIRLIGRWRSDEMLRSLHVQAEPIMRDFSRRMLQQGNFVLHPNAEVPSL